MRDHDLTRKIILYGILIILLVSTIIIGYYTLGDQNRHNTKAIIAIPENACIIIELKNPAEFPSDNSDLKSFIGKIPGENELKIFENNLSGIQRLLSGKDDFNDIIKDGVLYISLHKLSNNRTACLYSINIKDKELPLNKFIKDNYGNRFSIKHELYKGVTIYSLTEKNGKGEFYYFISKEVLACCNSSELIKKSAEQIISPYSILNDKNFSKLSKSAEIKADANVYINYNMFPDLRNFAGWTALDINVKKNGILLNGFTTVNDTKNSYLKLFINQQPQVMTIPAIAPSNTGLLLFSGYSNFKSFFTLETEKDKQKAEYLRNLNYKYNINAEEIFVNSIDNESGIVITQPDSTEFINNTYYIFKCKNIEETSNKLKKLARRTSSEQPDYYNNQYIGYLNIENVLSKIYGNQYNVFKKPYFTIINKYVVYASGSQALKRFINKYKSGKTLNKRPDYQSITENISNKANIFLYINISKSVNLSKAIENNPGNSIASFIANTNFQNLALEFNTSDETFYNTGYITFNSGDNTKHDFEAIWETKLDTTVQTKPFVFISNNSNNREIAVQDVSNNLYLLDNEGMILWKKNIKEKIIGDINEIDYYKNEKYQFLFNTANYIHLIDRNGNEVEGYPIRLNASSSNPLLVVDYKNDKSYRILVACNNRKIYNYTKEGKLNKGWKYTYHENPISEQFQYFNFDDKDCIFITDNKGKVIVLDSKGNIRSNPGNKIVKSYKTKFFIDVLPGRNKTRIVTIDSSGTIYSIYPDWRIEKDKITGLNQSPYFYFKDINNDENREFIFISNKQVKAFDQSKKQIFSLNINFTSTYEPDYFLLRDNIGKIGLVNTEDKEIYLINNKGKIDEGFPLRGSTPFVIEDLNNNDIPDLIVGSDSKVIVYELQ